MSFAVFTDACSNLLASLINELQIHTLACTYNLNGEPVHYDGNISAFDAHGFYDALRGGAEVTTSLLNTVTFTEGFTPCLENGLDIVYVGLSAGISGTMQAARLAAEELQEQFPERTIRLVDSMGAGFGTGLIACMAADLRNQGLTAHVAGDRLDEAVKNLCEYFIVDDLRFLHRTGRVSGAAAMIGTALHIMPMLRGDETGHIVASGKFLGRKMATQALLKIFKTKVRDAEHQRIAITHGDCLPEAEALAEAIRKFCNPKELYICPHEPFTGAHVGPGMLACFFLGDGR